MLRLFAFKPTFLLSWVCVLDFPQIISSYSPSYPLSGLLTSRYDLSYPEARMLERSRVISMSKNEDDPSSEKYLEQAKRLREEAQALQKEVEQQFGPSEPENKPQTVLRPTKLPDSKWTVKMDITGLKSDNNPFPVSLSMDIHLKLDGTVGVQENKFLKRGYVWEVERNPDGNIYLEFGVEAQSLKVVPDGKLYLNCQLEKLSNGEIMISNGVVTIKVVQQKAKWGLFDAGGILAEFKVVGNFDVEPQKQ
mmetsp:Transcript_34882/g.46116  ORF Transcript_34882/g.46116 Transcript_34882/m.46116 type:complete len:250 (+) Transcript_34882:49-798(+)